MATELTNFKELMTTRSGRPGMIGAGIILVIIIVALLLSKEEDVVIADYTVTKDVLEITITEAAEIQAVNYTDIRAPGFRRGRYQTQLSQIIYLIDEGTYVQKGDTLVKFDITDLVTQRETLEEQLLDAQQAYEELLETHKSQEVSQERAMQNAIFALENASLNLQLAQFEAETVKKERQLELQIQIIDSMKVATDNEAKAAIREFNREKQRDKIASIKKDIAEVNQKIESYSILAPFPGLVIHAKDGWPVPSVVKEGDTPYPGQKIISLPDLSSIKAVMRINDIDRDNIWIGQRGRLRLDAYPESVFEGKVTHVEYIPQKAISFEYSNLKIIEAEMVIETKDDILRPGMSGFVDLICDTVEDALIVPLSAVYELNGKNFIYIADNGSPEPREIALGKRNNSFVEVKNGVSEGSKILAQFPLAAGFSIGQYNEWVRRQEEVALLKEHFDEIEKLGIDFNYDDVRGKPVELQRPAANTEDIDSEKIQRMLERMGQEATPENIERVRNMIKERQRSGGGRPGQGMRQFRPPGEQPPDRQNPQRMRMQDQTPPRPGTAPPDTSRIRDKK